MSIPSVSGDEAAVGLWLRDYLVSLGWNVELQPVSEEPTGVSAVRQNNVIATLNETPRVWFSTHLDTVPPFIPPTEDDEKLIYATEPPVMVDSTDLSVHVELR